MNDKELIQKSQTYIRRSWWGLVIPLLGLLFAGVAYGAAKDIKEESHQLEAKKLKRRALFMIAIAAVVMTLWSNWIRAHNEQVQVDVRTQTVQEADEQQNAALREYQRRQDLETCFDRANTAFEQAWRDNGNITAEELQVLLSYKQQEIDQCQALY